MLNELPPRFRMFIRHVTYCIFGYLAAIGAIALYKGNASPAWFTIIGLVIGSALGALTRKVPGGSESASLESATVR
jgi:hypothetical protein